jgi:predicted nucleic acid-binding Zn finger protein
MYDVVNQCQHFAFCKVAKLKGRKDIIVIKTQTLKEVKLNIFTVKKNHDYIFLSGHLNIWVSRI